MRVKTNIDRQRYYQRLSGVESSNNPTARPRDPETGELLSSAYGLYQFTEDTWNDMVKKMGLDYTLEDRADPQKSFIVLEQFTKDNEKYLEGVLGRKPSYGELYLAHFLGAGGAKKVLTSDANTDLSTLISEEYIKANQAVFGKNKTVKDLVEWADSKFSSQTDITSVRGNTTQQTENEIVIEDVSYVENLTNLQNPQQFFTFVPRYYKPEEEEDEEEDGETKKAKEEIDSKIKERRFLAQLIQSGAFNYQAPQRRTTVSPFTQQVMQDGGSISPSEQLRILREGGNIIEIPTYQNREILILQNGGSPRKFDSKTTISPIYQDLKDFYERNKETQTYDKERGLVKLLKSPSDFSTPTSIEYDYCNDVGCMSRANRVIDSFVGSYSFFEDTHSKTNPSFGATFSANRPPTEEEIEKYPYAKGDTESVSMDSWDMLKQAKIHSPNSIVFGTTTLDRISVDDLLKDYKGKIAVGSYIGLGFNEGDDFEERANHTVRVVGFLSDGHPLVADYGVIVPLRDAMYIDGDTSSKSIAHVINVPNKSKYTFDYFQDIENARHIKDGVKYLESFDKMPVIKNGKTEYIEASDDYKKFHDTIGNQKAYITKVLGIDDKDYDRYAKIALTLGGTETDYGTSFIYKNLSWAKQSKGVAQLRLENVEDKYKKILSQYPDKNEKEAIATLLYIKELDKYKDEWMEKGQKSKERVFKIQPDMYVSNKIRGRNQQGYINNSTGRDILRDEGKEYRLPFKQVYQSDKSYEEEVNRYFKEQGVSDIYTFRINNGKREIVKKTKGTTIPNTLEDFVFYAWQSPNTVVQGDAQGESMYYKKNKEIYSALFE